MESQPGKKTNKGELGEKTLEALRLGKSKAKNQKTAQEIQKLHEVAIKYGKQLENAQREKQQLETYLEQISKEKASGPAEQDEKKKMVSKELKSLKKELEKITKNYNSISSANQKKRNQINALRKERTLYDHIFKTLEYQILQEEKNLLQLIKKNKEEEEQIQKQQENLNNIQDMVSKNKYEDFYKVIQEEKEKYLHTIEESLKKQFEQEHKVLSPNSQVVPQKNNGQEKGRVVFEEGMQEQENDEEDQRLEFLQNLYRDFKFYTEDNDIELLKDYMERGEELNQELFD